MNSVFIKDSQQNNKYRIEERESNNKTGFESVAPSPQRSQNSEKLSEKPNDQPTKQNNKYRQGRIESKSKEVFESVVQSSQKSDN